jgi:7-cyano-7-deazaguanine synthase in queuosine biosynthesis
MIHVALVDGAITGLSGGMDSRTWFWMLTPAGGEVTSDVD